MMGERSSAADASCDIVGIKKSQAFSYILKRREERSVHQSWQFCGFAGRARYTRSRMKIEARRGEGCTLAESHQQRARKIIVRQISRLVWKIKLRGEDISERSRNLEMVMARAARIKTRHDGIEAITSGFVRKQMTAIAETGFIVIAVFVGVPQVENGARHRFASARQYETFQPIELAAGFRFDELC